MGKARSLNRLCSQVVVTSSFASIGDFTGPGGWKSGYTYTANDWLPILYEDAVASGFPPLAYCASKKFAEQAAWDFVKTKNPGFDLVVLNPPMIYVRADDFATPC